MNGLTHLKWKLGQYPGHETGQLYYLHAPHSHSSQVSFGNSSRQEAQQLPDKQRPHLQQSLQRSTSSRAKTLAHLLDIPLCTHSHVSHRIVLLLKQQRCASSRPTSDSPGSGSQARGPRAKVRLPKQIHEERNRLQIFKTSKAKKMSLVDGGAMNFALRRISILIPKCCL